MGAVREITPCYSDLTVSPLEPLSARSQRQTQETTRSGPALQAAPWFSELITSMVGQNFPIRLQTFQEWSVPFSLLHLSLCYFFFFQ